MTISSFHVRVTNQICSHRRTKIVILLYTYFKTFLQSTKSMTQIWAVIWSNLQIQKFGKCTLGSSNLSNCFEIFFEKDYLYLKHCTNVFLWIRNCFQDHWFISILHYSTLCLVKTQAFNQKRIKQNFTSVYRLDTHTVIVSSCQKVICSIVKLDQKILFFSAQQIPKIKFARPAGGFTTI